MYGINLLDPIGHLSEQRETESEIKRSEKDRRDRGINEIENLLTHSLCLGLRQALRHPC